MIINFSWLHPQELPTPVKAFLLSIALVTVSFLLQGNIGINLGDEGFLWYGTIQTGMGEVPVLDFQSYDPGRYYWGAAWCKIFGNYSLLSLRISNSIFQAVGLTFGLLSLRRITKSYWILTVEGLVLLLWMYPRHKLFEPSIAMAAVYFAILLIENPSLVQHLIAGVFVGVAAFLGRNHGLYTFASFFLLIIFIWLKLDRTNLFRRLLAWVGGIILGYYPMFFMLAVVPGFFDSFVDSIKFLFRFGRTNLPLPVPWFWRADYSKLNLIQSANAFFTGLFFLMFPVFNALAAIYLCFIKRDSIRENPTLVASSFVSFTYMHYAFSRADLPHLGQAIHPLLIGLISLPSALPSGYKKKLSISLLSITLVGTLLSVGLSSYYYLKATAPSDLYVQKKIGSDRIWIDLGTANLIDTVSTINSQLVKQNEGLLIAPHWPMFYPILGRKSPVWDIYLLFPETDTRQKEMIEELRKQNVNWIILGDVALDGRDDLRFKNTHPLLYQHFKDKFEVVANKGLPENYQLLHRRQ